MKFFKEIRPFWLHIAKTYPNYPESQFEAGLVEGKANNIESSLQFYKKAFTKNPLLTKALNNYGTTLMDRGQFLKAKVYIMRAKELKPPRILTLVIIWL
jgi:Tfp pilus assembly protein PilF